MPAFASRLLAVAVLVTTVFLAAACSVSLSVPKDRVQQTISDKLPELGVTKPDSVACPADLPGEVGKSVRCAVKAGDEGYDAVATVTSVQGTNVNFDVKLEAQPVKKDLLAKKVAALVPQLFGVQADNVTCANDLPATVGATADCTVTASGQTATVRATVSEVQNGTVKFGVAQVG